MDQDALQCLPDCSGHGTFDLDTQTCNCEPKWSEDDCSKGKVIVLKKKTHIKTTIKLFTQNCAIWIAANMDDVLAKLAYVITVGVANIATQNCAIHGATSMDSAKMVHASVWPAGTVNIVRWKVARLAVRITDSVASAVRDYGNVVVPKDGMVQIVPLIWNRIAATTKTMTKVRSFSRNFANEMLHCVWAKKKIWLKIWIMLRRRSCWLRRSRMLSDACVPTKSTVRIGTETDRCAVAQTTASNYGFILWTNEISNWRGQPAELCQTWNV